MFGLLVTVLLINQGSACLCTLNHDMILEEFCDHPSKNVVRARVVHAVDWEGAEQAGKRRVPAMIEKVWGLGDAKVGDVIAITGDYDSYGWDYEYDGGRGEPGEDRPDGLRGEAGVPPANGGAYEPQIPGHEEDYWMEKGYVPQPPGYEGGFDGYSCGGVAEKLDVGKTVTLWWNQSAELYLNYCENSLFENYVSEESLESDSAFAHEFCGSY
jgi:hypothetical protein